MNVVCYKKDIRFIMGGAERITGRTFGHIFIVYVGEILNNKQSNSKTYFSHIMPTQATIITPEAFHCVIY